MRAVQHLCVVTTCGVLAAIWAVFQGEPTQAASRLAHDRIDVATQGAAPPLLTVSRRSGSVEAHFAAANTPHDGHLTREQAMLADWPRVAKHFDEIDSAHRGWVSVDQIHDYNRSRMRRRQEGGF